MDRNVILAIVLSAAVLLFWQIFITGPQMKAIEAARQAQAEQQTEQQSATPAEPDLGDIAAKPEKSVEEALAETTARVPIDTPNLEGSINLAKEARIDDLSLKQYRETIDPKSPMIRLLSPADTKHGHYIQVGWGVAGRKAASTAWTAPANAKLTPDSPVTLTRREGGLVFKKTYAVDDRFMITVTQTVTNEGASTETLTPYGFVIQRNIPHSTGRSSYISHEGPIAVVNKSLYERKYKKAISAVVEAKGDLGWVGITNKYWLAAAIPPQGEEFKVKIQNTSSNPETPVFQAGYELDARTLAPGETVALTSHLFGGAKDVDVLQSYEKPVAKGGLGVWDFDKAIDWGTIFWPLTRPIFYTLNFFGDLTGNFGVAILILTLIIRILLFPLANKGYESMSKMKKLQPEVKKLQERYKDDKTKLQQEMMALYQKEKMNPLAGCLPIFIQMPIFFSLYKTLFVTIELRHEPFIGWIKDLSAPDPTSVFNLFGLLPYDPTTLPVIGHFMGIGVLPLLMGIAMWLQTKLNPPPSDPVQAQIFGMMPIMFTFLFSRFASGLVLYWFWNTSLSILQQWMIMKRNGVKVDWAANMNLPWVGKKASAGEKKT